MRHGVALLAVAIAATHLRASAAEPAAPDVRNEDCLQCHEATTPAESGVHVAVFARSVHGALDCVTCHVGYTAPGPHELPPPADAAQAALLDHLAAGTGPDGAPRTAAPRAYLACGDCHPGSVDSFLASPHGAWLGRARPVAGPTCASCHGSIHEVMEAAPRGTPQFRAAWAKLASACEGCHSDPRLIAAAGLNPDVAGTYHDSVHGRLAALGSSRAPVCTDCHAWSVRPPYGKDDPREHVLPGGHATLSGPKNPVSSVAFGAPRRDTDNRVRTCAQCHRGATVNFAALGTHRLPQDTGPLPHFVHTAFSYLTALTLFFFTFHVAIDFVKDFRIHFGRRRRPVDPRLQARTVIRFDRHQRIQHALMLSGVILLFVTGWPLRGAGASTGTAAAEFGERLASSRKLLALFGSAHGAGVAHRVGAVLIMAAALYHLAYLVTLSRRRALPFSMVPSLKDLRDVGDNVAYMLGLRAERPRFERFSYMEKFDYWAVFWGIVMMVGTGFVFWFPVALSHVLPTVILTSAQIIHGEEATLAALFLFVVHFYNTHLKPSVFPMSWIWLDGRTTLEFMKEEHAAEYERTFGEGVPADRPGPPSPPAPPKAAPAPPSGTAAPGEDAPRPPGPPTPTGEGAASPPSAPEGTPRATPDRTAPDEDAPTSPPGPPGPPKPPRDA